MRFGEVAAFSGRALQFVGEVHLLAAIHFPGVVMASAPGAAEKTGSQAIVAQRTIVPQIMRLTIAIFVFLFLILGLTSCIAAERSNSTAETSGAVTRRLFIDPSSTSVALGKASLIVSPLTHRDGTYVGDYQLNVRPYFFKSERGTLVLAASDDSVRKLQAGTAINFTGKAVTRKDRKTHVVLGKALLRRKRCASRMLIFCPMISPAKNRSMPQSAA